MWFKKKLKDPLDQLDKDKWLKDLLVELNLMDVKNLIDMANVSADKINKEALTKFLHELQPILLKNIKEGIISFDLQKRSSWDEHSEYYKGIKDFRELHKFGICVEVRNDYYEKEGKGPLNYWLNVTLRKLEKETK